MTSLTVIVKINLLQGIYEIRVNKETLAREVVKESVRQFSDEFQQNQLEHKHEYYTMKDASTDCEMELEHSICEQVANENVVMVTVKKNHIWPFCEYFILRDTCAANKYCLATKLVESSTRLARNIVSSIAPVSSSQAIKKPRQTRNIASLPMLNRDPTALESVMSLSKCSIQDICTQCGIDRHRAQQLVSAVSDIVEHFGQGAVEPNPENAEETGSRNEVNDASSTLLQFSEDSPSFRKNLSLAEILIRSEGRRLSDITEAGADLCGAGELFCSAAKDFALKLAVSQERINEDACPVAASLFSALDYSFLPLRDAINSFVKLHQNLLNVIIPLTVEFLQLILLLPVLVSYYF